MADNHAFRGTQSVGIQEVLKWLLGLLGQLEAWQAIWKFLETLSQQSKRMDWSMTSFLILNDFF